MNPDTDRDERRQQEVDRRTKERQGKYDRRKNRCVHCRFFEMDADFADGPVGDSVGFCHQHERPMAAYAFVCILFEDTRTSGIADLEN